jgi:hypothetical protein
VKMGPHNLRTALKHPRPPRSKSPPPKAWLAERRALLLLDNIWENDVTALVPGPPVSLLCMSRRRSLPWISRAHSLEGQG